MLIFFITIMLLAGFVTFLAIALDSPDLPGQRSGLDDRAEQETTTVLPADWSESVAV